MTNTKSHNLFYLAVIRELKFVHIENLPVKSGESLPYPEGVTAAVENITGLFGEEDVLVLPLFIDMNETDHADPPSVGQPLPEAMFLYLLSEDLLVPLSTLKEQNRDPGILVVISEDDDQN